MLLEDTLKVINQDITEVNEDLPTRACGVRGALLRQPSDYELGLVHSSFCF